MKKLSFIDLIIIAGVIIALVVGIFTAKHMRQTADKQIEATSKITFQVFLRGVTVTGEQFPIKAKDKTFITTKKISNDLKVSKRWVQRYMQDINLLYENIGYDENNKRWYITSTK